MREYILINNSSGHIPRIASHCDPRARIRSLLSLALKSNRVFLTRKCLLLPYSLLLIIIIFGLVSKFSCLDPSTFTRETLQSVNCSKSQNFCPLCRSELFPPGQKKTCWCFTLSEVRQFVRFWLRRSKYHWGQWSWRKYSELLIGRIIFVISGQSGTSRIRFVKVPSK